MDDSLPLRCVYKRGRISIEIGEATLQVAAAMHPDFWDGESGADTPNIAVHDCALFAKAVVDEINAEDEQGNTLLTRMLDAAMRQAVENGCEGVIHSGDR